MAILDCKKTANHISNWIKSYADNAGIQTLVLGLSGGIDSALVALLCKMTGKPLVCVNMPCHSSSSAFLRAEAFSKEFNLNLAKVDLSPAHDAIYGQALLQGPGKNIKADMTSNLAVGGLRSCLRAPTLSYFANATRGLIVGTGNRSEDNITRYFQKYGDGCVDISPISDLFKNEVYELFKFLSEKMFFDMNCSDPMMIGGYFPPGAKAIYDAKPTADLWGPDAGQEDEKELGITYDEIEWADREDMRTAYCIEGIAGHDQDVPGVIFNDSDPAKHPEFYRYTGRQQQVIARLHQLEKISRHKMNANLPCCKVRNVEGLVR